MGQIEYLYTFILCETISTIFYVGLRKIRNDSRPLLHYIGFGLLMGFISFFILILLSTRFDLGWLPKTLVVLTYCAVFINSELLELFLAKRR